MEFRINVPKDDDGYLDRMAHAIFESGLSWRMVENKWPNFRKAFSNFSVDKVAKITDKQVEKLLEDPGIVRSEGKIRALVYNAQEFQKIKKEFGSFKKYMDSFGSYTKLMDDMRKRFKFLGPSNTRSYLLMAGVKLKPEPDEIEWLTKVEAAQ